MITVSSLKSFIKSVRASKTIAEERSIIRKESAKIRTHFRDVNLDQLSRRVLISKLLYLYILGEPTHFGQVECIKLLASNKFIDKKLGYMAASLLLDENQEVLTLLTNSLNNDMAHTNQYVTGLAITTLGNIASPELARDLYTDIEKIIDGGNTFLKKKAVMCAARLIKKDPDLSEIFAPKISVLIAEKNHGILLGTMKMIDEIYKADDDPSLHEMLIKKIAPRILDHLVKLLAAVYSPDYDVNGASDPFLFCALLQTLRNLFETVEDSSDLERLNDLLTQCSSKFDFTKNSGNAIAYEVVKTIFHINSDPSLRVLGVNILAKFLTHKDNNTRYVALNSLLSVVNYEPQAVQRHRSTILACLSDADISIRRRALELSFAIVNEQNIRVITKELLTFLNNSDLELKSYVTTQLTLACDKYSPNTKWHFETLIKMLRAAGNHVTGDILSNILALIMQNQDQELTRQLLITLYQSVYNKNSAELQQHGLNLVTVWCLGEYTDLVLGQTSAELNMTESAITDLITRMIESTVFYKDQTNVETLISYCLTAIVKLSIRFKSASEIEKLRQLLIAQSNSSNLEIQVRSMEYLEIMHQPDTLKRGILEKMPAPPLKQRQSISLTKRAAYSGKKPLANQPTTTEDLLLDLMSSDDTPQGQMGSQQQHITKENTVDLLSDIFGSINVNNNPKVESNNNGLSDLLGNDSISSTSQQQHHQLPSDLLLAHESDSIKIGFVVKQIGQGEASIDAYAISKIAGQLSNVNLLMAVPKTQKLKISSSNQTTITGVDDFFKQNLSITGKPGAKIKLRVKVTYEIGGGSSSEEQFDFNGFGSTL